MFLLLIGVGILLLALAMRQPKKKRRYIEEFNRTILVNSVINETGQAVDIKSLTDKTWRQRMQDQWHNVHQQIGRYSYLKIALLMVVLYLAAVEINSRFFRGSLLLVVILTQVVGLICAYLWLQQREKQTFEAAFPDALNMLASAVSSGESIMHAIVYVGKSLDNAVGAEFKRMGERLQLGESPDEVLKKSCARFPYPAFHFFVITLRANMQRGGQLKAVITRLNRSMFDARALDKKKYALTAEARMSAKIVCAIPFIFLFFMQSMSPENYEFIMFNEQGRPILYYMLGSELIGMAIIWLLMKGVR
ncbi:pilus assembly protein TadB [Vibrio sp. SM6]|uniref:Pilus assembly protein TadB n=1 Tax=Vibrio agarilyticus TaxID=2726741 RepID=A0A7X8TQG0_9VIBR|nr:type II secretion system F family protein [Vibrio agarilyticus]NLS13077.1 pilus assembly protein TadB [Vibrio agarilyticus]